jgi:hypothetical protein
MALRLYYFGIISRGYFEMSDTAEHCVSGGSFALPGGGRAPHIPQYRWKAVKVKD